MSGRLNGKTAIITGAGGGIGKTAALRFAGEGCAVAVADINPDAARGTAGEIMDRGGRAFAVAVDVSQTASVTAMIDEAEAHFGGIDILFNNAGIVHPGDRDVCETDLDAWSKTIAVNLTGVFLCCSLGIPSLLRRGGGVILNTASIVALVGSTPSQIAYTASKGGVVAMTREIAIAYARKGIRANSLLPGVTRTAIGDLIVKDEEAFAARRIHMPMGRLAEPDEIAETALYLCSSEASFITAQAIVVDGGLTSAYLCPTD